MHSSGLPPRVPWHPIGLGWEIANRSVMWMAGLDVVLICSSPVVA